MMIWGLWEMPECNYANIITYLPQNVNIKYDFMRINDVF